MQSAESAFQTTCLEFVSNYVDQGYPLNGVNLDFQKAFDKVPHKRLMLKIKSLGIINTKYTIGLKTG